VIILVSRLFSRRAEEVAGGGGDSDDDYDGDGPDEGMAIWDGTKFVLNQVGCCVLAGLFVVHPAVHLRQYNTLQAAAVAEDKGRPAKCRPARTTQTCLHASLVCTL
jgi:hypothetical protein